MDRIERFIEALRIGRLKTPPGSRRTGDLRAEAESILAQIVPQIDRTDVIETDDGDGSGTRRR